MKLYVVGNQVEVGVGYDKFSIWAGAACDQCDTYKHFTNTQILETLPKQGNARAFKTFEAAETYVSIYMRHEGNAGHGYGDVPRYSAFIFEVEINSKTQLQEKIIDNSNKSRKLLYVYNPSLKRCQYMNNPDKNDKLPNITYIDLPVVAHLSEDTILKATLDVAKEYNSLFEKPALPLCNLL